MIIDKIENLSIYNKLYPEINKLIEFLKYKELDTLSEKLTSNTIALIPISSNEVSSSFDGNILEAHKKLMDIHITLQGVDVIAYADVFSEVTKHSDYNESDDYALFQSSQVKKLIIPMNYFCIIPNNFAHMALYKGHSDVKKIVVKLPAPR